jgi:hypothetical protein
LKLYSAKYKDLLTSIAAAGDSEYIAVKGANDLANFSSLLVWTPIEKKVEVVKNLVSIR